VLIRKWLRRDFLAIIPRSPAQEEALLSNTSLARSGEETNGRIDRGRELYREHALDFEHVGGARWHIASDTVPGRSYEVDLTREVCECADHSYRGAICKHLTAASLAHAKSRVCSCCRNRVLRRFLSEVTEEDGLLAWFVGDELCADCIRDGYWE
jgi:hypothetical protein